MLAALEARDYDAVLIDLNYTRDTTSGQEGLDLLARLRELDGDLPVVVMTAWGTVDLAVEAMRRGARDFVQKPWENARLVATLTTQIALGRALKQSRRLEAENRLLRQETEASMLAASPAMTPVLEVIARVGPSDANVLIEGENGSGKGVVARALHAVSKRSGKPFVTLNAGGISEGLFESELFGHVRGAFTDARSDRVGRFELADGGTLFLDEIGNVPASQQAKLLRVLETGDFERVGSSRTCAPTSGSSRRPTPTCMPRSQPGGSGRTSSSASTRSRSACRPARAREDIRSSPGSSWTCTRAATASASADSRPARWSVPRAPVARQRARGCRRRARGAHDLRRPIRAADLGCGGAASRRVSRSSRSRRWRISSCARPWTASAATSARRRAPWASPAAPSTAVWRSTARRERFD